VEKLLHLVLYPLNERLATRRLRGSAEVEMRNEHADWTRATRQMTANATATYKNAAFAKCPRGIDPEVPGEKSEDDNADVRKGFAFAQGTPRHYHPFAHG